MNKEEIQQFCESELASYVYDVPDSALGKPWSSEKVDVQLKQLKNSIVEPYIERMELRDTFDQLGMKEPEYQELLVVADDNDGYKVFYDPSMDEFGLAMYTEDETPVTIGVRGDFVGAFLAR